MILYLNKSKCNIRESPNGEVLDVKTDEPILIDGEYGESCLLFAPDDGDGLINIPEDAKTQEQLWPYMTPVPKNYKL